MNTYPWQSELGRRLLGNRENLPHALLLKGRQGIGKLDFALHLARSILCESPLKDGSACNACTSCTWFSSGSHPDFRRVEPEAETTESGRKTSQIAIDQIRSLSPFMNMTTHRNGYRIVLIHPAEAMNPHAANALLKTLEEPQGKTLFLLVSHKPNQLLPTTLSRCRILSMPFPNREDAGNWLKENGVADPAPYLAEAGNSPLFALEMAGMDRSLRDRFLSEIGSPATLDPVAIAESFQKTELSTILHWLQKWCHDLASFSLSGKMRYFPAFSDRIGKISAGVDKIELLRFERRLAQGQRISTHPVNSRLFIEELMLAYRALAGGK